MVRLILLILFVLAVLGATAVMLLGPRSFAETRNVIVGRPAPSVKTSRTLKRTWQTGPSTITPAEEIVPRRRAFPAPVKQFTGDRTEASVRRVEVQPAEAALAAPHRSAATGSLASARAAYAAAAGPSATVVDVTRPLWVDPAARARAELACLQSDPQARQAFYAELRRKADQVRAGEPLDQPAKPSPCSVYSEPPAQR